MPAMSASPLTPLDYIAEGSWQDFLAKRPIAGGIAYESELYNCQLDESLLSLQRIDVLLTQIRRDMAKAGTWDEITVLADERYRNLLVFLAFYAGRVLARQWQNKPHWYGQFELHARYPKLSLITDDFYQHMAVLYGDDSVSNPVQASDIKTNGINRKFASVFFALQPIGLRLFGHIDRQFEAIEGGQVASGLYQAVIMRLPDVTAHTSGHDSTHQIGTIPKAAVKVNSATTDTISNSPASDILKPIVSSTDNDMTMAVINNTALDAKAESGLRRKETQAKAILSKDLSSSSETSITKNTAKSIAKSIIPPTPEIFTQLLTELDDIEVSQTAGNNEYKQARKILDQFEQHIAKQNKPRAQVIFSKSHQQAKQQALIKLKGAAVLGNTAAMLRLAMYELLGEGLLTANSLDKEAEKYTEKEAGVAWVKQAANQKDSRAQRLLSKMYYQGIGVPQDISSGKDWLEQAANNGHTEAASLVEQWQQAQALITTRQQEQHSIKRYQLLIGVVIVGALLLIIFV